MSKGQLEYKDVLHLIEIVKASANFSEIRVRSGSIELELKRGDGARGTTATLQAPAAPSMPANADAPRSATSHSRAVPRDGMIVVTAPMVGTVYHAPEPGGQPFVSVGQSVARGDTLCIIEVMKLMNSICAEAAGVVSEILVADAQAVEFGDALFVIARR